MADDDDSVNPILYDLFIQDEWHPQSVLIQKGNAIDERNWSQFALDQVKSTYRKISTTLSVSSSAIPGPVSNLINLQIEWKLARNSDGRLIAILTDAALEIRCAKDDYSSVIAKSSVYPDPFPKLRRIAWSPDSSLIACSYSTGDISIFDLSGSLLYTITRSKLGFGSIEKENRLDRAIAALLFVDYRRTSHWNSELLAIDFRGRLYSYLVSDTSNYEEHHTFSFRSYHSLGVTNVLYHKNYRTLIIGGSSASRLKTDEDDISSNARDYGVSCWRILDDFPYYSIINVDLAEAPNISSPLRRITGVSMRLLSANKSDYENIVHKMCLSPSGGYLAVVQCSGCLSVWEMPSLRKKQIWHIHDQPEIATNRQGFSVPEFASDAPLRKDGNYASNIILDCDWWSEESLILMRSSGAVTVASIQHSLRNLLGSSPECFQPGSCTTALDGGGFLVLEYEFKAVYRRHASISYEDDSESMVDSEIEEEASFTEYDADVNLSTYKKLTESMKRVLYFITENDRFLPQDKAPKLLKRNYRLLCLKSTTPEELYSRKIDQEEYGEALTLAEAYGLDCNLVYKRRWQQSNMSMTAIQDYLVNRLYQQHESKITDRLWVLQQCVEKVPTDIDAAKELLKYGLLGTNEAAFQVVVNNIETESSFIVCESDQLRLFGHDDGASVQEQSDTDASSDNKSLLSSGLKFPSFNSLNEVAKETCKYRLTLLVYLDRLFVYELILGNPHVALEEFTSDAFKSFRSSNIINLAIDFARASDWEALDILFTYFYSALSDHRLAILSNIPETTSPKRYKYLLPEVGPHDEIEQFDTKVIRVKDWCELAYEDDIDFCINGVNEFLYTDCPQLEEYKGEATSNLLTKWYSNRAMEIEFLSQQVTNAIDIVKLGIERNVKGLESLLNDLLTLEVIVYDCNNVAITLKDVQSLSNIDKMRLLLRRKDDNTYISDFKCHVLPYLHRLDVYNQGSYESTLHDYLIEEAKQSLSRCLLIFQYSKPGVTSPIIPNDNSAITTAADCIYSYWGNDQLETANSMIECLPNPNIMELDMENITILEKLKNHLKTAAILQKNGVPQCISSIKEIASDSDKSKVLMIDFMRILCHRRPSLSVAEWRSLLNDMLTTVKCSFSLVTQTDCYEIFIDGLLHSSDINNISLAGEFLSKSPRQQSKFPYQKSVHLILKAAREYFDSSRDYSDRNTSYARKCLAMIKTTTPEIEAEIDLINSLAFLSDLGLLMLPIEVRLCENRLNLIRKAISVRPLNYLKYDKLVKLGSLIQVPCKDNLSQVGQILALVAEVAIEKEDYKFTFKICDDLMDGNHSNAWQICWRLAECDGFTDLRGRHQLISFALTHCTADVIEKLISVKYHIEIQELYSKTNDIAKTAQGCTNETHHSVFDTLTNRLKLQDRMLTWISNPLGSKQYDTNSQVTDASTSFALSKSFEKIVFNDFYSSVYGSKRKSLIQSDPLCGNDHRQLLNCYLLRMEKLFESKNLGADYDQTSTVFLHLAHDNTEVDTGLALSYLLALPDRQEAETIFKNSNEAFNFKLAIYYYSLQLFGILKKARHDVQEYTISYKPKDILDIVVNSVTDNVFEDIAGDKDSIHRLLTSLQYYRTALDDYIQAQILRGLGRGVDTARFAVDDEYKYDTILGLAMTLRDEVFNTAINLAERYSVAKWDFYITHTEWLITDSGLAISAMEARIGSLNVLDYLKTNLDEARVRLKRNVYPALQGTDYNMLTFYYKFLNSLTDDKTPLEERNIIRDYQMLLKKIKSAAPGLDFKELTEGHRPLEVLEPYLTANNVHTIAKLSPVISDQKNDHLSASQVFNVYSKKMFWYGSKKDSKDPTLVSEWIDRYQSGSDFVKRLSPRDLIDYMKGILFHSMSAEKLSIDCRINLMRRLIKVCKEQESSESPLEGDDVSINPNDNCTSYKMAAKFLQIALKHLTSLKSSKFRKNLTSEKEGYDHFVKEYDISLAMPEKVEELTKNMFINGVEIKYIEEMIGMARTCWPEHISMYKLIKSSVDMVISDMILRQKRQKALADEASDPKDLLKSILSGINSKSSKTINKMEIVRLLFDYSENNEIESSVRLAIIDLLEQQFNLEELEQERALYLKTSIVVTETWKDQQNVNLEGITIEANRHNLFQTLLEISADRDKFLALAQLLQLWPDFCIASDDLINPWVQLLERTIVDIKNPAIFMEIITIHGLALKLDVVSWEHLLTILQRNFFNYEAVKAALFTDYHQLHERALNCLQSDEFPVSASSDEELIKLILERKLVIDLVATPIFVKVADYIRKHPDGIEGRGARLKQISHHLLENGHYVEASSLIVDYCNVHPLLQNAAIAAWLLQKDEE